MVNTVMGFEDWKPIFEDLRNNQGIDKINFVGGEPLLYNDLIRCCQFCKSLGFTVSIVSNGSLINREFLEKASGIVDWIGLSLDSADENIEKEVGRCNHSCTTNHIRNVIKVSRMAHEFGIKIKLNITVLKQSYQQDFSEIIRIANPERVKVFQVMRLEGHNDDQFDYYAVTREQFDQFVRRHKDIELSNGLHPVFESSDDMVDSYLMLDPLGRVMRNTGNVNWTEPYEEFMAKGADNALDLKKYIDRGGIYEWDSPNGHLRVSDEEIPASFRIAVFGITRSGKDTCIKKAIELISSQYGVEFIHYPFIGTMRRLSEQYLFKDFDETTEIEKGMLMVKYREMLADRSKHPYVITDEHYCYPTTYGGKVLHNDYTDAKFPFIIKDDYKGRRTYEVMFSEEYLDVYD